MTHENFRSINFETNRLNQNELDNTMNNVTRFISPRTAGFNDHKIGHERGEEVVELELESDKKRSKYEVSS